MDLCLLIDKFGLFGLGKAAIYVSPSIEMDAWGQLGRWGAIGPAALLLSLRLFLPGACSSSHVRGTILHLETNARDVYNPEC